MLTLLGDVNMWTLGQQLCSAGSWGCWGDSALVTLGVPTQLCQRQKAWGHTGEAVTWFNLCWSRRKHGSEYSRSSDFNFENFFSAESDVIALETEFRPSLGKHWSYLLSCACYDAMGRRKSLRVSGSDVPSNRSFQKQNQRTLLGLCRFPVKSSFSCWWSQVGQVCPGGRLGVSGWCVLKELQLFLFVPLFTYCLLLICF